MATEVGPKIVDIVTAELVECQPPPEAPKELSVLVSPEVATPTQQAAQATIEQTGADPPPEGPRG